MNDQRRNAEQHAQSLRNFAAAFGRGQANALDRFGNPIHDGDKLMLRFQVDPIVDVVSVNPVLDPKAPAGLIDVMCTVTFPIRVQAGVPFQMSHIVARRAETQPPAGSDNGKGPALTLVDPGTPDEPPVDPPDAAPPSDDESVF